MEQAAARTQLWTNRSLLALFLICLGLALELARPFLSPLVLAAFLVAVAHRPYHRLHARLGGRTQLAAALATLVVALVLVLPAAIFVAMLVGQFTGWADQARAFIGPDGVHRVFVGQLPLRLQEPLLRWLPMGQQELATYVSRLATWISSAAPSVLTLSVEVLIQAFVLVLAIYYLFADGQKLVAWVTEVSPLQSRYTRELIREFYRVAYAMMVGTAAVAVLQGLAAWMLFGGLGIPNPLVWAMALAFASFVPGVGVGLVYLPMAGYLLLTGHSDKAIICLIYSVTVIVIVIDHLVRPQLVRGRLTLHPLLVFVSIFGGVYLFGLVGLLLGPLIAATMITVVRIYARDLSLKKALPVALPPR
jgi:predicted PurR-regulated permease PerM